MWRRSEEREQKRAHEQADEKAEPTVPDTEAKQNSQDEPILDFKYPQGEVEEPNPTMQGESIPPPYAPISDGQRNKKLEDNDRPSVKEQIRKMREERKQAAAEKQTPTRDKAKPKRGSKAKPKSKPAKGR